MSDAIIAGRFDGFARAEITASRLRAQGLAEADLSIFYVDPPGQRSADPGGRLPGFGAVAGILLGATAGAPLGAVLITMLSVSPPLSLFVLTATTGLGAYAGSLVGALSLTHGGRRGGAPVRNAGVLLAVHVEPRNMHLVCELLRKGGALDIERARGRWREGRWADFDPLAAPVPAAREGEVRRAMT